MNWLRFENFINITDPPVSGITLCSLILRRRSTPDPIARFGITNECRLRYEGRSHNSLSTYPWKAVG